MATDYDATHVPDEVRAMLTEMGLRHPLDCTPQERAAGMAALHARVARAYERVGDTRNAEAARRMARREAQRAAR